MTNASVNEFKVKRSRCQYTQTMNRNNFNAGTQTVEREVIYTYQNTQGAQGAATGRIFSEERSNLSDLYQGQISGNDTSNFLAPTFDLSQNQSRISRR